MKAKASGLSSSFNLPIHILHQWKNLFPGLLSATTVALAAAFIAEHYGAPIMLIALLMGMSFKFLTEADSTCRAGIDFASKRLMRIGVALLGLGISINQIKSAGMEVLLLTFGGVLFTIISGLILSRFVGLTFCTVDRNILF